MLGFENSGLPEKFSCARWEVLFYVYWGRVCFVFYDFINGEVSVGSLFEGDFVFSFVEAYDDVWWCFFHVVVF